MPAETHPPHIIPRDRVATLVDGIYAISMTLLVITISVPPKYEHQFTSRPVEDIVTGVLPDLLHYFIAFTILSLFWYFEHQRFRHLRYLDRPLVVLTFIGLAFVCLLPFSTDVAGDFPFDKLGAVIFELNILVIGMIAFVQWVHIRERQADLAPDLDSTWIRREIRWALVLPALATGGIVLSVIGLPWSTAVFLLAPLIMAWLYWKAPVDGMAA